MFRQMLLAGAIILLIPSFASALVTCSSDSFSDICRYCSFTEGRVDPACKDAKEASAKSCLATNYPVMSLKYGMGMCPAIDACVEKLRACNNLLCPGNDASDCASHTCSTCYQQADRCALMAARDCNDEEKCGNGKCSNRAGEDETSCCQDCGCKDGFQCDNGLCKEGATGDDSATNPPGDQPISDRDVWDTIYDWDVLGCIPFLLLPIAAFATSLAKLLQSI